MNRLRYHQDEQLVAGFDDEIEKIERKIENMSSSRTDNNEKLLVPYSLTHWDIYSLTYLLTYLLTYSLIFILTHSLTYLLIHLLTHSPTHTLTYL